MKRLISTPTKKQVIVICSITLFLFLRTLIATNFLTDDGFSNRQYLIFGALTFAGLAISITSIIVYRVGKNGSQIKKL
jgi:hypothetical protein